MYICCNITKQVYYFGLYSSTSSLHPLMIILYMTSLPLISLLWLDLVYSLLSVHHLSLLSHYICLNLLSILIVITSSYIIITISLHVHHYKKYCRNRSLLYSIKTLLMSIEHSNSTTNLISLLFYLLLLIMLQAKY